MAKMKEKMPTATDDIEKNGEIGHAQEHRRSSTTNKFRGSISVQRIPEEAIEGQVFSMNDCDPVLDKKMRLVNEVNDLPWSLLNLPLTPNRPSKK